MIIDSHLHLFRHGFDFQGDSPLRGEADVDAYEALMGSYGIDGGLVVCYEAEGIDPDNNAYVRELARSRSWIASVAYLDAGAAPQPSAIERLLGDGHAGIALYLGEADAARRLQDWPGESWDLLSQRRSVVSLNARPEATAVLEPIVQRAIGCEFLFAHLGLPGALDPGGPSAAKRLEPLLRLAGYGNVGVKISGLYAVDPSPPHTGATACLDLLFDRFDAADLHWGSDFSPALGAVSFDDTLRLACLDQLSQEHRSLVLGDALARKLRGPSGR